MIEKWKLVPPGLALSAIRAGGPVKITPDGVFLLVRERDDA